MFSKTISSIPISYNTNSHNINFDLIFGEGKTVLIVKMKLIEKTSLRVMILKYMKIKLTKII